MDGPCINTNLNLSDIIQMDSPSYNFLDQNISFIYFGWERQTILSANLFIFYILSENWVKILKKYKKRIHRDRSF